ESEPIIRDKYADVDVATASFGQNINVTPLQMISAASAVVNGGELLQPRVVKQYMDSDGNAADATERTVVRRVISQETSSTMRTLLEGVVAKGTGSGARIKGQRVGGKTGTSEKQPRDGRKIASFCGFAPANDPKVIVLLMLDEPTPGVGEGNLTAQGGQIAAPTAGLILADILRYMGIQPQYTESEIVNSSEYVPNITGLKVDAAEKSASSTGFKLNIIGGGDTIVDQQPKGGVSLAKGSVIVAYTKGTSDAQNVTVPDVKGQSRLSASSIIKNAQLNFKASDIGDAENTSAVAVEQSPEAGSIVPKGSVVSVKFIVQDVD
ncbi:MAG: penicillin-binding transpeptidase domain-containing protein, partial [Bacillota bacterium]|nr:penicillin-binding transpeptidase domain-containing protein [Bacillota bacterium]